jgi:hypothetical protein
MINVNCYADFRFQVDIQTPNASGKLARPSAGAISGITLRLSDSETGAALNPAVDNLPAAETTGLAGRFYYSCDTALLQSYILPLGVGKTFWAIWSKSGDMNQYSEAYRIMDRTRIYS